MCSIQERSRIKAHLRKPWRRITGQSGPGSSRIFRINSTRNFSRNAVIELAVQDYVDEAERVIEEYGRNMDSVSEEGADFDYDLAIFLRITTDS